VPLLVFAVLMLTRMLSIDVSFNAVDQNAFVKLVAVTVSNIFGGKVVKDVQPSQALEISPTAYI
jgi:hypothetical protein